MPRRMTGILRQEGANHKPIKNNVMKNKKWLTILKWVLIFIGTYALFVLLSLYGPDFLKPTP